MKKPDRKSLIVFPILIFIGLLVALAGSQGGSTVGGNPGICFIGRAGLSHPVAGLYPGLLAADRKIFDLTGSLTYISVISIARF